MCNREAPEVEQFARQHGNDIEIVGIGTQDTFGEAQDFLARHGITFTLLWDESFETWQAFGVSSQPAAAMLSPTGENLGGWFGMYDEGEVLELAGVA